ncbi:MAG: glucokinase, partial [Caldimicrobium sp.]
MQKVVTLIGDIGASHSRLALIIPKKKKSPQIVKVYKNKEFHHFEEIIEKYLKEEVFECKIFPERVLLGVAGPVLKNKAKITNLGWEIEAKRVQKRFSFKKVILKNDLYLLAGSFYFLKAKDLRVIKEGKKVKAYPKAFIAVGTGLGISFLISKNPLIILPSEGGHTPLSIREKEDLALYEFLQEQSREILWEEVLSGRGLENLYACYFGEKLEAPLITERAKEGKEREFFVIKKFFEFLGRKCYEVAVMMGPFGGIYMAGGVIQALSHFFERK